jgi:DNA topoisomerase VI subunit A
MNKDAIGRIEGFIDQFLEELCACTSRSSGGRSQGTTQPPVLSAKKMKIVSVAALVYELMSGNRTMSLRDVYYTLIYLFRNQEESNAIIMELGNICQLSRADMCIHPVAKGYIGGCLQFELKHGLCSQTEDGAVLPSSLELIGPASSSLSSLSSATISSIGLGEVRAIGTEWIDVAHGKKSAAIKINSNCKCVLIIEKEGVFRRLMDEGFDKKLPCILITGDPPPQ